MNTEIKVRLNGESSSHKIREIKEHAKLCNCSIKGLTYNRSKDYIIFIVSGTKSKIDVFCSGVY